MKLFHVIVCVSGLAITGCARPHAVNRQAHDVDDVEVGILDATPRTPSMKVTPFTAENVPKSFTDIAHLTVQGRLSDEAALINFLAAKARALGANGLVMGPTEQPFTHYPASATDQTLRIYRAEAIIY